MKLRTILVCILALAVALPAFARERRRSERRGEQRREPRQSRVINGPYAETEHAVGNVQGLFGVFTNDIRNNLDDMSWAIRSESRRAQREMRWGGYGWHSGRPVWDQYRYRHYGIPRDIVRESSPDQDGEDKAECIENLQKAYRKSKIPLDATRIRAIEATCGIVPVPPEQGSHPVMDTPVSQETEASMSDAQRRCTEKQEVFKTSTELCNNSGAPIIVFVRQQPRGKLSPHTAVSFDRLGTTPEEVTWRKQ